MNIQKIYKLANAYETVINELRNSIVEKIAERLSYVELPNVKRISSSPFIVVVPASVVFSNSWNMSTEYYICEKQTKLLIEKIKSKQTITDIKHFIDTTISDGYIMKDTRSKMYINSAVKEALIEISTMMQCSKEKTP